MGQEALTSNDYDVKTEKDNDWIRLMPKRDHKFTLIFMHGLGDSAMGFFPIFAD